MSFFGEVVFGEVVFGDVVVNCEDGGLLVTGYDAPTPERRGQVARLDFT